MKKQAAVLMAMIAGFLACFYLPVEKIPFDNPITEALALVKWYAREHVLLCLVPAFFIAGAISVFVSQASVMKYLGAGANKFVAYGVASVSGTILAVCSCTVLPLFAGIYKMGAGLGPAAAFLYSGPAINVLAIILTARILGLELGIARAVGAVIFSVLIGLSMHLIYRREENERKAVSAAATPTADERGLMQNVIYFAVMVGILVFANWGKPTSESGIWFQIHAAKWIITSVLGLCFGIILAVWFKVKFIKVLGVVLAVGLSAWIFPAAPLVGFSVAVVGLGIITFTNGGPARQWFDASWDFTLKIVPLLFMGVFVAGLLLGKSDGKGLIPTDWIARSVGDNSVTANLFASVAGAFMYFATLTEVPIVQGLTNAGMAKGPSLALLLAGPALSVPNMLVIRSVMGTQKTVVYILLVVVLSTVSGLIYGSWFA